MDRRSFLKSVAATAAVGAVAPQVLAEPATPMCLNMAMANGASRVAIGGTIYEIVLDVADWTWKWIPASGIRVVSEANKLFLKVIDTETVSEAS